MTEVKPIEVSAHMTEEQLTQLGGAIDNALNGGGPVDWGYFTVVFPIANQDKFSFVSNAEHLNVARILHMMMDAVAQSERPELAPAIARLRLQCLTFGTSKLPLWSRQQVADLETVLEALANPKPRPNGGQDVGISLG